MTNKEAIEILLDMANELQLIPESKQGQAFKVAIKALEQEPKTGHWITIPFGNNHGEYRPNKYACSECGWEIDLCRGLQQDTGHRLFCEHCGANMVEP